MTSFVVARDFSTPTCVIKLSPVLKPSSLRPNDSLAAVTLENEALLYAFFIVFAALMERVFAIYVSVVSQNLRFDGAFFRRQNKLASNPNSNLVDDSCHPRSLLV